MNTCTETRWTEYDNSIVFNTGYIFHKRFVNNYAGLTIMQARKKARKHYAQAQQNRIISYLKSKNLLKSTIPHYNESV